MKHLVWPVFLFVLMFASCENGADGTGNSSSADTTKNISDTVMMTENGQEKGETYENDAFRDVKAEKTGEKRWKITGRARVFEASFSYYIEEGHYKLAEGHVMAEEGAPAWGKFSFEAKVDSIPAHTHPHLVLYTISAKDGRPQHELIIPLQK